MFHRLIEATLGQLNTKQKSITRLFPDFFSNPVKVKGVIEKGGVRLSSIDRDKWTFKVHSGTEEGLWYDVVIRWKNVEKDVQKLVSDRRNWIKDKKRADLRKIATKLFKDGNVELSCDCPAQQFWGPAYQLTQKHAKYGDQEDRSPDIRNPKNYGQYCKHVQVLMRTLPFYKTTIANWLGKEFKDLIQKAEGVAVQITKRYQAAGQALAKRSAREAIQEAVAALPEPQQALLDTFGRASEENMQSTSTYPGEEDYVKFWMLSDGTLIHVPVAHGKSVRDAGVDFDELMDSGAARGSVSNKILSVENPTALTKAQQNTVRDLYFQFGSEEFITLSGTKTIRSPDHLRSMLGESKKGAILKL